MPFRSPIDGTWNVEREIAAGSSSRMFKARDESGREAVVKQSNGDDEGFQREIQVHETIGRRTGFPEVYFSGNHEGRPVLVMQNFKYTLKDLYWRTAARLTRKDVLKIGIQMINRIRVLHSYGYVHRNVHPENIMVSSLHTRTLYLVDFGCTKKFKNNLGLHVARHRASTVPVTFRFGSVNALQGYSASRKDDLESLLYTLIAISVGSLPWSEFDGQTELEQILNMKEQLPNELLCDGVPSCISNLSRRIRALSYSEYPPYAEYCDMLKTALRSAGGSERQPFSWQE